MVAAPYQESPSVFLSILYSQSFAMTAVSKLIEAVSEAQIRPLRKSTLLARSLQPQWHIQRKLLLRMPLLQSTLMPHLLCTLQFWFFAREPLVREPLARSPPPWWHFQRNTNTSTVTNRTINISYLYKSHQPLFTYVSVDSEILFHTNYPKRCFIKK